MKNQVWFVVYGSSDEVLSCDGPFTAGNKGLYAAEKARSDEGHEVVMMVPNVVWNAIQLGWDAAVEASSAE